MSKIPNHTLWARATNSAASSSSRVTKSMLAKSHPPSGQKEQSPQRRSHCHSISSPSQQQSYLGASAINAPTQQSSVDAAKAAAMLAAVGAVGAPYYGPQPAAFVEAYGHQQVLFQAANLGEAIIASSFYPSSFGTSSMAGSSAFSTLNARSYNIVLSAPALRNFAASSLIAPSPRRLMHTYSQSQSDSSIGVRKSANETALSHRKVSHSPSPRNGGRCRLLAAAGRAEGVRTPPDDPLDVMFAKHSTFDTDVVRTYSDAVMGSDAFLTRSDVLSSFTSISRYFPESAAGVGDANAAEIGAGSTLPYYSPVPSPDSSRGANADWLFRNVPGERAKLAKTTTSETDISVSEAAANQTGDLQYVVSTSSTSSTPAGASGALPPQASAPAGSTDQWAKTFNIPRSTKRHDFMFEHGAYGIPKRHPLSSIRSSGVSGADGSAERSAPSHDVVPSGKVRAATDLLSAAAEFFVGPQNGAAAVRGEYRPFKGRDALQAALAGGSTAEGHELRQPYRSSAYSPLRRDDVALGKSREARPGVHRMAIRGPDGRIIKERLRSVQVGEDAYFLRPDALGVADGVGGWASRPGADPALFSRLLMHFCAVELSRYDGLSASELAADNGSLLKAWASVDPVEVMHRAWERCVRASRREGILGSSTALIGLLRGDELRIANMGDCVLMIIRRGEMMFRSTEQQHSFNFPVQLGMMGDTTDTIKKHVMASQQTRDRAAGEGEVASGALEDYDDVEEDGSGGATAKGAKREASTQPTFNRNDTTPPVKPDNREVDDKLEPDWDEPRRDAGRWAVRVEAGDIIVVGSDGLMDNLFDEDIMEEVLRFLPGGVEPGLAAGEGQANDQLDRSTFSPQLVSEALCSRAKAVSEDSRAISSPFQQRAMEEGLNYVGGKHDDISVLVCLVGERDTLDVDSEEEEAERASSDGSSASTPKVTSGKLFIR